ncbi:MAG: hypothetical protein ACK41O_18170 [Runella zeae]
MAKVENATMLVGERSQDNNQEWRRTVRVSTKFRFAHEELGTTFKVRVILFGTDKPFVDSDNFQSSMPFRQNWETYIGDFDFSGGNGILSTSARSLVDSIVYEKTLIPTTTEVDFSEERPVLESKLNEDPAVKWVPEGRRPVTQMRPKPHQDEVYVKIQLIVESTSPVQVITVF